MGTIGIYVHPRRKQAYRASTTHAAPDNSEWILVSEDPMIGLAQVREIAQERALLDSPQQLQWTGRTDTAGVGATGI